MARIQETDYEKYILNALDKVRSNTDLCKLLYYADKDNPLEQPNIDPLLLTEGSNRTIYLSPFTQPNVTETKQCILSIFIDRTKFIEGYAYQNVWVGFSLLIHCDCWQISDGIRPLKILKILDSMFNYSGELNGINKSLGTDKKLISHSPKFQGYYTSYKVTDFS